VVDECGDELIFEEDLSEEEYMFAGQCTFETKFCSLPVPMLNQLSPYKPKNIQMMRMTRRSKWSKQRMRPPLTLEPRTHTTTCIVTYLKRRTCWRMSKIAGVAVRRDSIKSLPGSVIETEKLVCPT